jgi:large subunit ribosomal protein L2
VDFKRHDKLDIPAKVQAIEYDPNRTARLALLAYADGEKRYILAPERGEAGRDAAGEPEGGAGGRQRAAAVGDSAGHGGPRDRAGAGRRREDGAQRRHGGAHRGPRRRDVHIKLPSGEMRKVSAGCYATIGQVGNLEHENISLGKAGRKRWKGIRPTVRGVAMNPVDHPMGGGEGRSSGGGHPVTPWGQLTKGKKTRNKRKPSGKFIVQRRKKVT